MFGRILITGAVITLIVSGNRTPCANGNYIYSVPMVSGATYTWTVTNGSIISGQGTPEIQVKWNNSAGIGTVLCVESL